MLTLTIWSQAEGLDWSCQRLAPRWPCINYGRDELRLFGCLGSEPRLAQSQTGGMRLLSALRWSRHAWERGVQAVPRLCIIYPGIYLTTEEKSWKNLSQGIWKALSWPALNAICLVDLAITGDGLNWPAGPYRPWFLRQVMGSTLGQRKYLPSCRTGVFPTSANFESKLAVRALMWLANSGTLRSSCVCLLLTYQGPPVARLRHLDCNTCSLLMWVRAADLHAGHT